MSKKSKKGSRKASTKSPRKAARKAGEPRACGVCGKKGHNKRSHEKGGRLAK